MPPLKRDPDKAVTRGIMNGAGSNRRQPVRKIHFVALFWFLVWISWLQYKTMALANGPMTILAGLRIKGGRLSGSLAQVSLLDANFANFSDSSAREAA